MSLAKPQAVQYVKEDLKSILDSTINIIHPQALMHNVQIITNYPEKNCELSCNSHQLKQVFLNFLKNAIESMAEGGNIYIDLQMNEPGKVLVSIADEGAGIESDRLRYPGNAFLYHKR